MNIHILQWAPQYRQHARRTILQRAPASFIWPSCAGTSLVALRWHPLDLMPRGRSISRPFRALTPLLTSCSGSGRALNCLWCGMKPCRQSEQEKLNGTRPADYDYQCRAPSAKLYHHASLSYSLAAPTACTMAPVAPRTSGSPGLELCERCHSKVPTTPLYIGQCKRKIFGIVSCKQV